MIGAVALLVACGAAPPPGPPGPRRPPPPLRTFLPEGAAWVLEGRPADLWAAPEVRRALEGSIGEADLVAHAGRTGVDLRRVDQGLAAGFGESVVWMARGGHDFEEVARLLRERLRPVERDDPRRGLAGILLDRPVALRRVGARALVFGDGEGAPAARVRRGAGGPDVTALARRVGDAPLRLLQLGPLDLPADTGAGLLLSRIRVSGFALTPSAGKLRVRIALVGDLPSTAAENLTALVRSIGDSGLGRAFGADDAARRAEITVTPSGADIVVDFEPAEVSTGVRTLFVEGLRGLFSS